MSADVRLLSPNRSRIYPNARTGAGVDRVHFNRRNLQVGEADAFTWDGLVKCGWTPYNGPATTDERGYVVPGSDPGAGL